MKTVLFIDLSAIVPLQYEKEFISTIKQKIPEIQTLDLDSDSDSMLFSYAGNMIKDSEKSVILIKADKDSKTRSMYGLADILVKNKEKVLVLFEGENQILEKMLSVLQKNFYKNFNLIDFITTSEDFLKNGQ